MAALKFACIAVVCVVVMASTAIDATVSCSQVSSNLAPCVPYARSGGAGAVPGPCCDGIRKLNSAASTTPDRQAACNCMKTAANNLKGINFGVVSTIPGKCGVNIPYQLSPSTDCTTVR